MSRLITSSAAQLILVPTSLGCLLAADHPARFFDEMIEQLDLTKITSTFDFGQTRGRPAYDPIMMTKIIMYGYSIGVSSTRKLERACLDRIDFRFLTGNRYPDYRSLARFKKRHLKALAALDEQVLAIAAGDGLVEMREVATDGTKILANASKHKAMSFEHMCKKEVELKAEIKVLKQESHKGSRGRQKEVKEDLRFKEDRLKHIRKWKRALQERALSEGKGQPEPRDQINFSDSQSRIMRVEKHFEQAYNAQAAVDKRSQIILVATVTQDRNDKRLLVTMLDRIGATTGLLPDNAMFDAGYFSEEQIKKAQEKYKSTQLLVPPDRQQHGRNSNATRGRIPANISTADRMRRKLRTKNGRTVYGHRKTIVEPVFGQIKEANLEFRQFSYRGLENAQAEWSLVCTVHNMQKIYRLRKAQNEQLRSAA